jgi:hypothetical protein
MGGIVPTVAFINWSPLKRQASFIFPPQFAAGLRFMLLVGEAVHFMGLAAGSL